MMQLPEKKICYILPLEMEVSTPVKLINDLDKANGVRKYKFYFSDVPFNSMKMGMHKTHQSNLQSRARVKFCGMEEILFHPLSSFTHF